MRIRINKLDSRNVVVETRKRKEDGTIHWVRLHGYCSSVMGACIDGLRLKDATKVEGIKNLKATIEDASKEFEAAVMEK